MQSFHASGRVAILVRKPEIVLNFSRVGRARLKRRAKKTLWICFKLTREFASSSHSRSSESGGQTAADIVHSQPDNRNLRDGKLLRLGDRSY